MVINIKFLKIGETARAMGISVTYLKVLDKKGIFIPERRLESGYRLYSERQIQEFLERSYIGSRPVNLHYNIRKDGVAV